MRSKFIRFFLYTALVINLINCAKKGTPTGGEKDITPPVVVSTSPPPFTTNFTNEEIRINFDEYIKLKDLQKQLIVSPPLEYLPEVTPQGGASKFLKVKIIDTLTENTTYVLNFGQSVTDNNEGNPYPFLNYVFSTGDYIDSLTVNGFITDAVNNIPEQFVSVMLYKVDTTFTDSIVYNKKPTYITNTLDSLTTFQLPYLKEGKYMLIAMKDVANNYLFDQKADKIGFISDFIDVPTDSVFHLKLFSETPNFKAAVPSLAAANRIIFGYEGNASDMEINLLGDAPEDYKYRITHDREKDTLHYWFTPFEADSLMFTVSTEKTIDTFKVRMKELYKDTLILKQDNSKAFTIGSDFKISASTPLVRVNMDSISVINKDSISLEFTSKLDTLKNQVTLKWSTEPDQVYKITAQANTFEDFFGNINDTVLSYSANTKSLANLGSIRIKLNNVSSYPVIVQLTDQKGVIQHETYSEEPKEFYEFRDINPASYLLRVIFDTNGNGEWDTGNYLQKKQPERISYYPAPIDLKANWELEEEFTLD